MIIKFTDGQLYSVRHVSLCRLLGDIAKGKLNVIVDDALPEEYGAKYEPKVFTIPPDITPKAAEEMLIAEIKRKYLGEVEDED